MPNSRQGSGPVIIREACEAEPHADGFRISVQWVSSHQFSHRCYELVVPGCRTERANAHAYLGKTR